MAVLHEHAAPITELHGERDASAGTQTVYVFAALLPSRNAGSAAVAGQDLAFFEVDVDWVVPTAATIFQGPDFAGAEPGRCRNSAEACVEHLPVIGLDTPW